MKDAVVTRRIRRVAKYFDVLLTLVVAASYPLYVQLDALPRADEFGPPVLDRFPWAVTFVVLVYLGYRCATAAACAFVSTLASVSAGLAHTDAAEVTGVAKSPLLLSVAAIAVVFTAHLLRRTRVSLCTAETSNAWRDFGRRGPAGRERERTPRRRSRSLNVKT